MCSWAVCIGEGAVLWAPGVCSYVLRAFWRPTGFSISLTTEDFLMENLPSFAEHGLFVPSTPLSALFQPALHPGRLSCVFTSMDQSLCSLVSYGIQIMRAELEKDWKEKEEELSSHSACRLLFLVPFFFFFTLQDSIYLSVEGSPRLTFFFTFHTWRKLRPSSTSGDAARLVVGEISPFLDMALWWQVCANSHTD